MGKKGEIVSFRPEIKVLDATIRDGGLVNNFYFTDDFVRDLYKTNIKAGVDYMEFGYRASKELFDVDKFGKWKFCDEEDIRNIVGENDSDMKISVMADVGRTDFKKDIIDRKDSVVDMYRIATYLNTIPSAIEMIEYCHNKGYETTVNIMAISNANTADLDTALDILGRSCVDEIYIVDSYGSLYPEQIAAISERYLEVGDKYGKQIGMHAHNNQQLAFANTIEALSLGVNYLDATVSGMGRGAGNCYMELLLGFLKNPKYNLIPLLDFIEGHIQKLRDDGVVWGYDVPYLLTGRLNKHPRSAIEFIKEHKTGYSNMYLELLENNI